MSFSQPLGMPMPVGPEPHEPFPQPPTQIQQQQPLFAYDNNNQENNAKLKNSKKQLDDAQISETASNSSEEPPRKGSRVPKSRTFCAKIKLNNLWSVWYGFICVFLMAYTAAKCTKRLIGFSTLPWNNINIFSELHVHIMVTLLAILLLPLFLGCAVFKIGNNANDGFKFGQGKSHSRGPRGFCSALWTHGGPTAPFIHIVIALCFLIPKLSMESRLIQFNFLSIESIWKTDLDFVVISNDRLVILNFITPTASHVVLNAPNTTPMYPEEAMALIKSNHTQIRTVVHKQTTLVDNIFQFFKNIFHYFNIQEDSNYSIINPNDVGFGTLSIEYINLALALIVFSVRYSSVFWRTNKCFALIFSFQLLINTIQLLISYSGMSVLYKIQVVGAMKVLPLNVDSFFTGFNTPFLLNGQTTLILFLLASFIILFSSSILYLYGHSRYNSYLNSIKGWSLQTTHLETFRGFRTHAAALAALVGSAVVQAPILHDLCVVYRGSLDSIILASIVASISTLFLWVLIWLGLTIKYNWRFHITVTLGKSHVRTARSVRLVTDIELGKHKQNQPLLILGNGRAFTVSDAQNKKTIMNVIDKQNKQQTITTQAAEHDQNSTGNVCALTDDECEEQIYWLRPRPRPAPPQPSPDSVVEGCWLPKNKSCLKKKHSVKFNDVNCTSVVSNRGVNSCALEGSRNSRSAAVDEDEGDYATLRELPLLPAVISAQQIDPADGKLLASLQDDNVTYASSPPLDFHGEEPIVVNDNSQNANNYNYVSVITVHNQTPRCLRRADSGIQHEDLTLRSNSISTDASASPPEHPASNTSESSSGVHSVASNDQSVVVQRPTPPIPNQSARRAASTLDLQQKSAENQWKSGSLQRNVQPVFGPKSPNAEVAKVIVKPSGSGIVNQSDLYGYRSASGKIYDRLPAHEDVYNKVGIPVVLENAGDEIIIHRKSLTPSVDGKTDFESFGRSTNMKMTTFNENNKPGVNIQNSSATLPHFPTQPHTDNPYPHCSTMPLPAPPTTAALTAAGAASCANFPPRQHTTLPTHHNGVRLFPVAPANQTHLRRIHQQQIYQPKVVKMLEKQLRNGPK